jgi:hypothetical protein
MTAAAVPQQLVLRGRSACAVESAGIQARPDGPPGRAAEDAEGLAGQSMASCRARAARTMPMPGKPSACPDPAGSKARGRNESLAQMWLIGASRLAAVQFASQAQDRRSGATVKTVTVTSRDRPDRPTDDSEHRRWGYGLPSVPGPQPYRGGASWLPRQPAPLSLLI